MNNYKDSMKDHCHVTGKYRGAAHNACNLKLRLDPKTPIPVVFHNLQRYDGHLLMQGMAQVQEEISCIPNNTEKYIFFSLGNLKFTDSLNFMMSSLDTLVKGSAPEDMKITEKTYEDIEKMNLLLKKGIYPHKYMDGFERFIETELLAKEEFFSKLAGKGITDEEYAHAEKVWAEFRCKTLGNYHNLYLKTDVVLLAAQKVCMGRYRLDPAHYHTALV